MIICLLWWYSHATRILLQLTDCNDDLMYHFSRFLECILSFLVWCFQTTYLLTYENWMASGNCCWISSFWILSLLWFNHNSFINIKNWQASDKLYNVLHYEARNTPSTEHNYPRQLPFKFRSPPLTLGWERLTDITGVKNCLSWHILIMSVLHFQCATHYCSLCRTRSNPMMFIHWKFSWKCVLKILKSLNIKSKV